MKFVPQISDLTNMDNETLNMFKLASMQVAFSSDKEWCLYGSQTRVTKGQAYPNICCTLTLENTKSING